eukprot:TRINITY_DN4560_c0_g1_i1.p1 TRINITY_DN4560_c0_g1~~TRINITY_DN4560_c0_g1_i1.p1  ORF type:complete len:223 (-),score=90.23 TRINITY_DN4560_c0_g1_i1:51-719(-)
MSLQQIIESDNILQRLEDESKKREVIKDLAKTIDSATKAIIFSMQQIHLNISTRVEICQKTKAFFPDIQDLFRKLGSQVDPAEQYKFNSHWRNSIQQLVFVLALIQWIESDTLISWKEAQTQLGFEIHEDQARSLTIELEDYLYGIMLLPQELARLSLNCVIGGEFAMPQKIARFASELAAGFGTFNFKNDLLRRKYDSIKYDVKKIEEVLYDISVRKLSAQ